MKRLRFLGLCALTAGVPLVAQDYSISAYTIEPLHATSSGGGFTLTGSITQTDPQPMTGGNFSVKGDFWAVVAAIHTPGAPRLRITVTETNTVRVAWSRNYGGFQLQQSPTVLSGSWVALTNQVLEVEDRLEAEVNIVPGHQFFRLEKQP